MLRMNCSLETPTLHNLLIKFVIANWCYSTNGIKETVANVSQLGLLFVVLGGNWFQEYFWRILWNGWIWGSPHGSSLDSWPPKMWDSNQWGFKSITYVFCMAVDSKKVEAFILRDLKPVNCVGGTYTII